MNKTLNSTVDYTGADTAKKRSVGAITGICALVLVGASALTYNLVPQVKNAVRLAVLEPSKYVQTVAKENSAYVASAIAKQYSNQKKTYNFEDGISCEYNASLNISQDVVSSLSEYILGEGDAVPDTFVTNYQLNGKVNSKDNLSSVDLKLLANSETLLSANLVSDSEAETLYCQIPELSDGYLLFTPSSEDDEDYTYDYYGMNSIYDNYFQVLEQLTSSEETIESDISAQDLEDTIVKYTNIIIDHLTDDTTLEKSSQGDVLGVDYSYNKLTTKFTNKDMVSMCQDIAYELHNDDVVKKLVIDSGRATEDEYNEWVLDLQNIELTGEDYNYLEVNTYVNNKGVISGIALVDNSNTISAMYAKDGSNQAFEGTVTNNGSTISAVDVTANEVESNVYTGNFSVKGSSDSITLDFTNLTAKDNQYSGTITGDLSACNSTFSDYLKNLVVDFNIDESSQNVSLNFSDKVTIGIDSTIGDAESVTIPTDNVIDYTNDADTYFSNTNDNLFTDILTKVGLYDWYQSLFNFDYTDYITDDNTDTINDEYEDYEGYEDGYNAIGGGDDEESEFSMVTAEYKDLNKIKVKLYSKEIEMFGEPTEDILSLPCVIDEDTNQCYTDYETIYAQVVDGKVVFLQVSQPYDDGNETFETPDIDINGIKLGSSYKDINKTFGTDATADSSYVTVYEDETQNELTFFLDEDGNVNSLYWSVGNYNY